MTNIIFIPAGERVLRYKNTVCDNIMYFSVKKGMGIGAREPLKSMTAETARRDKVTFLISSHDLNLFSNLAGRYLLLFHGRIVCLTGEKTEAKEIRKKYEECRIRNLCEKERPAFYSGALEKERICVIFSTH